MGQKRLWLSRPTGRLPVSVRPFARPVSSGTLRPPFGTFGDSQDEEPLPEMARPRCRRAAESFRSPVTQRRQVARDRWIAHAEVASDVFEEDPCRLALPDDPGDMGPEVPLVGLSSPPAGHAEGLAGVSRSDEIHNAAPLSPREGGNIRPHRRVSQGALLHARDQELAEIGFPLHVADCASAWHCQLDAEIESTVSGAQGEDVWGT